MTHSPPTGLILVVDDTPVSLHLLVNILTAEGYHVLPANNGQLALDAVAAHSPELILLDVRMPGLDGFEVFRRLKARSESCDIPVIFFTAKVESYMTKHTGARFTHGLCPDCTKKYYPELDEP